MRTTQQQKGFFRTFPKAHPHLWRFIRWVVIPVLIPLVIAAILIASGALAFLVYLMSIPAALFVAAAVISLVINGLWEIGKVILDKMARQQDTVVTTLTDLPIVHQVNVGPYAELSLPQIRTIEIDNESKTPPPDIKTKKLCSTSSAPTILINAEIHQSMGAMEAKLSLQYTHHKRSASAVSRLRSSSSKAKQLPRTIPENKTPDQTPREEVIPEPTTPPPTDQSHTPVLFPVSLNKN